MPSETCLEKHSCRRCQKEVYCQTFVWACPWLNGDEDDMCYDCLITTTAEEVNEARIRDREQRTGDEPI